MRDKLNNNPLVQAAVIGVLLLVAARSSLLLDGRRRSERRSRPRRRARPRPAKAAAPSPAEAAAGRSKAPAAAGAMPTLATRPLPPPVVSRLERRTRPSSCSSSTTAASTIDLVKRAGGAPRRHPGVATFVVPANQIARYAAITQGVDVNRVPGAGRRAARSTSTRRSPTASVSYGFQSPRERRPGRGRRRLQGPDPRLPPVSDGRRGTTPATCGRSPTPATRPRRRSTAERAGTPGLTPPIVARPLQRLRHRRPRRPRLRRRRARPPGDRRSAHRRPAAGAAAARAGRDHRRPALARGRRALRPRPHRPLRLPGRHGGGEPDLGQHRAPLPGAAGRLRRQADAAGRDGRPDQRPRGRRHPDRHRRSTAGSRSPPRRTSRR